MTIMRIGMITAAAMPALPKRNKQQKHDRLSTDICTGGEITKHCSCYRAAGAVSVDRKWTTY